MHYFHKRIQELKDVQWILNETWKYFEEAAQNQW